MGIAFGFGNGGPFLLVGSKEYIHKQLSEMEEREKDNAFIRRQCSAAKRFMAHNRDFARMCREAYEAKS